MHVKNKFYGFPNIFNQEIFAWLRYAQTMAIWYPFEKGATLGQKGSEEGIILRDEEHPQEARITLERDTRAAPFAITCGIYGCMMHTRFFSLESEATSEYDAMKIAMNALLLTENEGGPEGCSSFLEGVDKFVQSYP